MIEIEREYYGCYRIWIFYLDQLDQWLGPTPRLYVLLYQA